MESVGDYLCCCPFLYPLQSLLIGRVYDEKSAGFVDIEKILLVSVFERSSQGIQPLLPHRQ